MKQFLLRYGVFAILLVMAAGLFLILGALSIRQKAPVQIFVTGAATARAYLTPAPSMPGPAPGDTLRVVQTAGGDMAFTVDSLRAEGSDIALSLRATVPGDLSRRLGGNTYTQGYVYTGRTPLLRLVLEKVR